MPLRELVEYVLTLGGDLPERSRSAASGLTDFAGAARAGLNAAGALSAGVITLSGAVKALNDDVFGTVDELNTLAQGSGLAQETVSGLRLAAKAANKDLSDLIPKDLGKRMVDADNGLQRAKRGFDQLGVSVTDSSGELRSADAVYRDLVRSLLEVEDPTRRAGLASQVLGEQGRQMLSAFSDVGDLDRFIASAEEFGITAGPEAIAASNKWWSATSNLSLAFEDIKVRISEVTGAADVWVNNFSLGLVAVSTFGSELVRNIGDQFGRVKGLLTGEIGLREFVDSSIAAGNAWADAWDDAKERAREFWELNIKGAGIVAGIAGDMPGGSGGGGGGGGGGGRPRGAGPAAPAPAEVTAAIEVSLDEYLLDTFTVLEAQVTATAEGLEGIGAEIDVAIQNLQGGGGDLAIAQVGQVVGELSGVMYGPVMSLLQEVAALPDTLHGIMDQVDDLVNGLVDLPAGITSVLERAPDVAANVATIGPQIIGAAIEAIPGLITATITFVPNLISGIITSTIDAFANVFSVDFWLEAGKNMAKAIGEAIANLLNPLKDKEGRFLGTDLKTEGDRRFLGIHIPKYETGTLRVPETGPAIVHEGEMIIPAAQARQIRQGGGLGGPSVGMVQFNVSTNDSRSITERLARELGGYGLNLELGALVGA